LTSCCRIGGNARTEARQRAPTRRLDKLADRLIAIKATNIPAFSQRAVSAIATVHIASTSFAMDAMLKQHAAQLKLPRLDAYISDVRIAVSAVVLAESLITR
jgi:DNA-binding transcriptional regulator YbjK